MVRPAVRQAARLELADTSHGPEQSRRTHHPELGRRAISKDRNPNDQNPFLNHSFSSGRYNCPFLSLEHLNFEIRISDFNNHRFLSRHSHSNMTTPTRRGFTQRNDVSGPASFASCWIWSYVFCAMLFCCIYGKWNCQPFCSTNPMALDGY